MSIFIGWLDCIATATSRDLTALPHLDLASLPPINPSYVIFIPPYLAYHTSSYLHFTLYLTSNHISTFTFLISASSNSISTSLYRISTASNIIFPFSYLTPSKSDQGLPPISLHRSLFSSPTQLLMPTQYLVNDLFPDKTITVTFSH